MSAVQPRGSMKNAAGGRVLQALVLLMNAIQTDGRRGTKGNVVESNEKSDGGWTFWCVTFMYTLLVAMLTAAAVSCLGGVRPQKPRAEPAAPALVPGARKHTMATQSQTRYCWKWENPRFEPLAEKNHGAWETIVG